jgi:hypothetical protein
MIKQISLAAALILGSVSVQAALTECTVGSFSGTYVGQYTMNSVIDNASPKDKDLIVPSAVVSVAVISNGAGTLTKVQIQQSIQGIDQRVQEYTGVAYTFNEDLCQVSFPLLDEDVVLNLRARNGVTGVSNNAQGRVNIPNYEMTVPLVLQRDLQARW